MFLSNYKEAIVENLCLGVEDNIQVDFQWHVVGLMYS